MRFLPLGVLIKFESSGIPTTTIYSYILKSRFVANFLCLCFKIFTPTCVKKNTKTDLSNYNFYRFLKRK